ncbi:DUF3520 domain-containing protein [Paracoccus suum]|uniref:DUF3520 domain-containing protein n=1 Tax=Paracoccus suum TaxID=2259340 RepID=A0A344PMB3_9RHOB|nr:von Willebrand factor type A domain-containing protein [Paracoccus suum]AXC50518.1 DUF3520 domain-containing protein [Paracoccus suum]
MTPDPKDELARLAAALRAAPQPDERAKRDAVARSMEVFDQLPKESEEQMRPSQDRPQKQAGFLTGVRQMLSHLTGKQALAFTTSAAALCLAIVINPLQQRVGHAPVGDQASRSGEAATSATPKGAEPLAPTADVAPLPAPSAAPRPSAVKPSSKAQATLSNDAAAPVPGRSAETTAEVPSGGLQQVQEPSTPIANVAPPPAPSAAVAPAASSMPHTAEAARSSDAEATASQGGTSDASAEAPAGDAISSYSEIQIVPIPIAPDTEAFANADDNPVKVTAEEPVSTFSADVDTASYAVVRDSIMAGELPPAAAVRVEEMVNYFPYNYPAPDAEDPAPFKASIAVLPTPWNPGTQLVRIGLQGRMPAIADRPPLNLVFLIDTSGSMEDSDKLPLLKQSLRMMLGQLRPEDQIAIVAYAGSAGEVLPPTFADKRNEILGALDRLEAGGSTNGAEGLELAYRTAESMAKKGEVSRILLATDGDFNVGISDPGDLEDYVARKRMDGTYLSVLGFGRGNLDDATMQALAQKGNGQAAYIDTLQEAQKVLVDQLSGALFPIADDVKLQVEWNPSRVAEYRLIGYETRALRREDFNNDKVDAGELGAGHAVTALYEVAAPGSPALLNDPLRYGTDAKPAQSGGDELGFLRMRYKLPGQSASKLLETPILADGRVDDDARFAAAMAGFGQLLKGSPYIRNWNWHDAIALAQSAKGADPFGYRNEAISLMRLAETLQAAGNSGAVGGVGSPEERK